MAVLEENNMTNKLTVTVDGKEIEVEEGDRFYLKVGIYSFDRVVVIKRQALDFIGYNFDPDGEPRWFTFGKIDFTRPAPDEDGWIKYYGTGQPVGDDVVVDSKYNHVNYEDLKNNYLEIIKGRKACEVNWDHVTHYRIVGDKMHDHLDGMSIKQANDKINEEAAKDKWLEGREKEYDSMTDNQKAIESFRDPWPPLGSDNAQVGGNHYQQFKIQPHEYIYENGLGFHEGNIIKYVTRHKLKGGKQDLEKARDFINKLIELEYGQDD